MCGRPDDAPHYFMRALDTYLMDIGEQSIGGMFLLAHAYDGGLKALCVSQPGLNGEGVEVRRDGYRFIVRNTRTSQEVSCDTRSSC
jgi:hypothetical protein